MAKGYPIAFKAKVVNAYRTGEESQREIAERYEISINSLIRWDKDDLIDDFIAEATMEIEPTTVGTGELGYLPHQNMDLSNGKLKNPQDEDFCRRYVFSDAKHDEVNCYMQAYDKIPEEAGDMPIIIREARHTLARSDITYRIANLLKYIKVTDEIVDTQLHFMILQNVDFRAKLKAIEMYKQAQAGDKRGAKQEGYDAAMDALRGKQSK